MIRWILGKLKRKPDRIIGDNYLHRWYLTPRNRYFKIYLHKFVGSDDDRALHDHPWWTLSILITGTLKEHSFRRPKIIPKFLPVIRSAKFAHRLEVVKGPVYTLFFIGPIIRSAGFYCPDGWRHWTNFMDESGNRIDKGCD